MKSNRLSSLPVFALIILILSACGGGEKPTEAVASEEFDAAKTKILNDINQVIKNLPPPSEVPYLLMATGSDYDPTLVNPVSRVDDYTNPASKAALNLGIYTTDIGYLTSYDKAQESLNYMTACQKLAESLGIASAMDLELISRFERNLSIKDSLKSLVDDVIFRAGDKLTAMDRMNIAGLVLAGTYVEGLYISTKIIESYPTDLPDETRNLLLEPFVKIVVDQKPALDDLLSVLGGLEQDEAITKLTADLTALKTIYESELAEVSAAISNNTGGLMLKAEVLTNLTKETQRIRASYIE